MSESEEPWPLPVDLVRNKRHSWIPLEASPDGILSMDAEGNIIGCNQAACQLLGFSASNLRNRNVCQILTHSTTGQTPWIDRVKKNGSVGEELELVGGNGQIILVQMRTVALRNASGEVTRIVGYVQDITGQKKLDQLKDDFIGLVSHELRSPLTVIIGAISTALSESDYLPPEETRQLLQDALWEAEALSHLLGNLLELARAQVDRVFLHVEPVNIRATVQDTIERVKSQTKQHRFMVDIPAEISTVKADRLRLERILYNLLENAVKYSPQGGDIRVSARPNDEGLVVAVADNGVGLSPTDQDRIFGFFERIEDTRPSEAGGVGLGLVVCQRLVEVHGGHIWVESEPGHGTTFYFTLPDRQR
jgi:PAS domain S-box-containing protein